MEAVAAPLNWSDLSEQARSLFRALPIEVPTLEAVANVKRRVRRFGYEARMADDVLQVPDPNGHWLELKAAPENWPRRAEKSSSNVVMFEW